MRLTFHFYDSRNSLSEAFTFNIKLTITLKTTDIEVIPKILAQYGKPITAFRATQGVNIVTAKFNRLRIT